MGPLASPSLTGVSRRGFSMCCTVLVVNQTRYSSLLRLSLADREVSPLPYNVLRPCGDTCVVEGAGRSFRILRIEIGLLWSLCLWLQHRLLSKIRASHHQCEAPFTVPTFMGALSFLRTDSSHDRGRLRWSWGESISRRPHGTENEAEGGSR